jgi:pimeloyl-ACP methyl ester carboxylesterase
MAATDIIDIDGPVHVADHGGDGSLVVLVHGLEGCHLNWMTVGPALAGAHRVIAPDLYGFGLTPPGSRGSGLEANADLVAELVRKYGDGPATLVGNSMGGLVAMLTATRHPEVVSRLVLVDPALPPPNRLRIHPEVLLKLAGPTLPVAGPQLIRLYRRTHTPEEHNKESLAFITADPDAVDPAQAQASLEMTRLRRTMSWSIDGFVDAARSIAAHTLSRRRFDDLVHRITQPTLLIHGDQDRLVPIAAARRVAAMRPDWQLSVWEHTGHVPMIEDPYRFTREVLAFLG